MGTERIDLDAVPPERAREIVTWARARRAGARRFRLAIAGESGSGKTVLAHAVARQLSDLGEGAVVLQMDDYFHLPPRANEARRREDIDRVGIEEVDRERLERDLEACLSAPQLVAPTVDWEHDAILQTTIDLTAARWILVEGTYALSLENVEARVLIHASPHETAARRRARGREAQDDWLTQVLAKEHEIVQRDRARADLIVDGGGV